MIEKIERPSSACRAPVDTRDMANPPRRARSAARSPAHANRSRGQQARPPHVDDVVVLDGEAAVAAHELDQPEAGRDCDLGDLLDRRAREVAEQDPRDRHVADHRDVGPHALEREHHLAAVGHEVHVRFAPHAGVAIVQQVHRPRRVLFGERVAQLAARKGLERAEAQLVESLQRERDAGAPVAALAALAAAPSLSISDAYRCISALA
mmetsp:Transcript_14585/g.46827  ORF Transcript_14585/g.46827 Transcript_14585/m.46827 type:complete len:208 (+) Transcript_14585:222-845(+)